MARLEQTAEKLGLVTSGAKAPTNFRVPIAALKARCATPNEVFSAACRSRAFARSSHAQGFRLLSPTLSQSTRKGWGSRQLQIPRLGMPIRKRTGILPLRLRSGLGLRPRLIRDDNLGVWFGTAGSRGHPLLAKRRETGHPARPFQKKPYAEFLAGEGARATRQSYLGSRSRCQASR